MAWARGRRLSLSGSKFSKIFLEAEIYGSVFFFAIYPAEYRITVQCLHDTQVKYTMDEKCLKAQNFLSPQRKDKNCLGNLVDHPSFSLTLTKLFATGSTSSSTNLLAFLCKKKIQDFHLNTLFHLLSWWPPPSSLFLSTTSMTFLSFTSLTILARSLKFDLNIFRRKK